MVWESRGTGGTPLAVVHSGYGLTSMLGEVLDRLASHRQVVTIELQGHGHTRDVDRPFSVEAFGDDLAGLIENLGLMQADLLGYSLGGGACLRCGIQHPDRVLRLALVSIPIRRTQWRSTGATGWVIRYRRCTHRLVRHLGRPRRNGRRTRPTVDRSGR